MISGLIIVHIIILLNLRFTAWPEIFSFPYLFNNGFDLYKDMVHPYTPLLTISLAYLYKVFGYNVWVVKFFTYALIIINDLVIFKITSKITKNIKYGFYAVLFYVLIQPFLDGNQLWFDFTISTPVLLGLWLLIDKKYFWSGVAFAVAFLIKQNSALFLLFGLTLICLKEKKIKDVTKYIFGSILPIIPLIIYLYQNKLFNNFLSWILIYPTKYWTNFPNYVQLVPTNKELLILLTLFIPAIYLLLKNKVKDNFILFGSLVISIILIYPRFSFFHFQTGIAILAIIFGIVSSYIKKKRFIYLYLVILYLLIPKSWGHSTRFIDDNNLPVATNEKIYLLGPHSLNYVTSNSLPPKPWIDNFGWYFEIPNTQENLINGWEVDPPKYIYWSIPRKGNWYDLGTYQPKEVVKYIKENYEKTETQNDVEVWKLKNI